MPWIEDLQAIAVGIGIIAAVAAVFIVGPLLPHYDERKRQQAAEDTRRRHSRRAAQL